jgi:hypothetical protein
MTKLELITRILDGVPGVRKDGAAWLLPEHPEVSIYVALPAEVLTLPRVARVTATADIAVIETHKGESFLFATDVIAGAKFGSSDGKPAGARSAGFR